MQKIVCVIYVLCVSSGLIALAINDDRVITWKMFVGFFLLLLGFEK